MKNKRLLSHSSNGFGINQYIVKDITILVLSKSMELALTR